MLCHIQKHTKIHMYSARDKKETLVIYDGTMDIGLLSFLAHAHARTCTSLAWVYGEGVVAIYWTLIVPPNITSRNGGENYFDQTVPRTPAIFTSLLHIFDLRSRTTIKKLFSIEVPPCITAIETSHKQKNDVQIGTTNAFPSIHFPSESRQTSHNIFW